MTAVIEEVDNIDDSSTITALSITEYLGLPFDTRYELASQTFPEWLLSEPISFPADHLTYGWACRVPACVGAMSEVTKTMLCVRHEREFADRPPNLTFEEFAKQTKPIAESNFFGWGLTRRDPCAICGPGREVDARGYCAYHIQSLRRHLLRGGAEVEWREQQTPSPPHPVCSVPQCVHDGISTGLPGAKETRICQSHRSSWARYLRKPGASKNPESWANWFKHAQRDRSFVLFEDRGLVALDRLPGRLQCEIRYGIHRHSAHARRSQLRPSCIQEVVHMLADAGIQTLNDPALPAMAEATTNVQIRRILLDLPVAARSLSVTKQEAKEAGWFDPVLVGTEMFVSSQTEIRTKPYDLTTITQRWLRDLLWDHLEYLALQPEGKRPSEAWVSERILGIRLFSRALRQLFPDEGNDPRALDGDDARTFKELWDLWYKEKTPLIERRTLKKFMPITELGRYTHTNAMRTVLTWGRKHDVLGPWIDSFLMSFPTYDSGRNRKRPAPRPIDEADFRLLVSDDALQLLDDADTGDIGFSDIWMAHAFQGGRITETLRLRLGCIGVIGDAQPYLWRDISKIHVVDYGMPCYHPVYERLLRRQEKTREKLRIRYADQLAQLDAHQRAAAEDEWERTMPLFPSPIKNLDLSMAISQAFFRNTFNTWLEKLGLRGITTHRTRATLATALLNNGAPPELVRQMLGHMSQDALAHYARYSDDNLIRHLRQVWAAGPGMEKPGSILLKPSAATDDRGPSAALGDRVDLTVIPVEHGLCRYGPVVGGSACPAKKNCTNGELGPCEHFILTGADLAYWERKRDAAYHFAEGAPTEEAREYILSEWKPWELVLAGLREALDEIGLLGEAEKLDLRSPVHDYFSPVFATGWQTRAVVAAESLNNSELVESAQNR